MKVRFWLKCNKEDEFDIEKDLNITIEEWVNMREGEKHNMVREWAWNFIDYGYEQIEDK